MYWVDRYLPDQFDRLMDFLGAVAQRVRRLELRLLSGKELSQAQIATLRQRGQQWTASGFRVKWRRMERRDIGPLHRRQLVGPHHADGFTLPPVDRVLCLEDAGNEADSYSPCVQCQVIEDAWDRAHAWV